MTFNIRARGGDMSNIRVCLREQISRTYKSLIGIAVVLMAAGCASQLPSAPSNAMTDGYNYIIGPGDAVNIVVWRNP